MGFVVNLLGFPAVKEFWKSVKNWQLSPWVWCTTFSGHSVRMHTLNLPTTSVLASAKVWSSLTTS